MICYGQDERHTDSHSYGIRPMFFVHLRMANARFRTLCCKKAVNVQEETRALWHAKTPRGTIVHK